MRKKAEIMPIKASLQLPRSIERSYLILAQGQPQPRPQDPLLKIIHLLNLVVVMRKKAVMMPIKASLLEQSHLQRQPQPRP